MKGILFDLDGVLYDAGAAVPGAADAVAWVRAQGIPHLFLTNTTSRPRAALVERLAGFGIEAAVDDLLMVGDDVKTDVGGAQEAGLRAALVRTGKFRPSDLEGDVTPDAVLDSVAGLPERWASI